MKGLTEINKKLSAGVNKLALTNKPIP